MADMLPWIEHTVPQLRVGINNYQDTDSTLIPRTTEEISCLSYCREVPGPMGGGLYAKEIIVGCLVAVRFEQDMQGKMGLAIAKDKYGLADVSRTVFNCLVMRLFGPLQVPLIPREGPSEPEEISTSGKKLVIASKMVLSGTYWSELSAQIGYDITAKEEAVEQKIMRVYP